MRYLVAFPFGFSYSISSRSWWVWPSWLRRQIVALEIVGSSPIIHPSANFFEIRTCATKSFALNFSTAAKQSLMHR